MDDPRPTKKVRQACEPCRRKKTRCSGERPACSYCARLGQICVYAGMLFEDSQSGQKLPLAEERVGSSEGKMGQLFNVLSGSNIPDLEPAEANLFFTAEVEEWSPSRASLMYQPLDNATLRQSGQLYLTWCHRQPIELFPRRGFINSLEGRDPELLLALTALASRFPPGRIMSAEDNRLENMATRSRELVMRRLIHSQAELSTLQTLCLLGMIRMQAQNNSQAELDISIASHLVENLITQAAQPSIAFSESEELRLCIRSVVMLRNLYGSIPPAVRLATSLTGSTVLTAPLVSIAELTSNGNDSDDIMRYIARMTEVWQLARIYAAHRPIKENGPPWAPTSDYSCVLQAHLEIDSQVPSSQRYKRKAFEEQDPEELRRRRDQWGPWLFLQFVYATIPCLLNHPFLLCLRLANFKHSIPHSFIQQSFEQISRYTTWVCHFLDILEEKQFATSDPTIAHCVVIVATIHLQHSFVTTDNALRNSSRVGLQKCMDFLRRMSSIWPVANAMVEDLDLLQMSVVAKPSSGSQIEENLQRGWSIDATLLRNILIYGTSGRHLSKNCGVIKGTLISSVRGSHELGAEFDLVGSVGILGHKAVSKDSPIYPPSNKSTAHLARSNLSGFNLQEPENCLDHMSSSESWMNSLFFGVGDFSQAIGTWVDFNTLS